MVDELLGFSIIVGGIVVISVLVYMMAYCDGIFDDISDE